MLKVGATAAAALLTVALFIAAALITLITAWTTLTNPNNGSPPAPWPPGVDNADNGPTGDRAHDPSWTGAAPSPSALADIPTAYLVLYQRAAPTCPGLSWTVLAGIGKIESDHGRSTLPGVRNSSNSAGAMGPMQFLGPTFAQYSTPVPPGGADPPNPYDPTDAIYAAARMLCRNGAANATNLPAALFAYNHSTAYVNQVLAQAHRYQNASTTPGNAATPSAPQSDRAPPPALEGSASLSRDPDERAATTAVAFARSQIGQKYVWGGNGAADGGFDCSGLTAASYAAAGITLPRTAQTQFNAGPTLPPSTPPRTGDLVFFGTGPTLVTHVGIATSATTMIDSPDVGALVREDPIQRNLVGITRPSARD